VLGEVFTSPSPDLVLAAIQAVAGPAGVLLVVKNYTGDRLNFGLAAEMARAQGIQVEMVVVADDLALARSDDNAGRRGLAGTILVHKIAGAAAERGASLLDVTAEARAAARDLGTMGVALSPCTVPAAGKPSFSLGPDEIELGLGIHGEPGIQRATLEPADALVDRLLDVILPSAVGQSDARGRRIVLLINNLGGTPAMELLIAARHAIASIEARRIRVERVYLGTFLSALEMAGISLSVLEVDDARLALLDASTDAPAWPNAASLTGSSVARASRGAPAPRAEKTDGSRQSAEGVIDSPSLSTRGQNVKQVLEAVVEAVLAAETQLTELDRVVGDGDLGTSLSRGARAVLESISQGAIPLDDPGATIRTLGLTLQAALGGTSGAIYALLLLRTAAHLGTSVSGSTELALAEAFEAGCQAVSETGGAVPGDRTMLDALMPASTAFASAIRSGSPLKEALARAAEEADAGARATADMAPRRGRSSYLGHRVLGHPDPGAVAVAIWLSAVATAAEKME